MAARDAITRHVPHPFFGAYFLAVVVGVAAALTVPADDASWALGSTLVHRCEVGLVVGAVAYLVMTAGWLAYQGRYLGQFPLPGTGGGGGVGGESQPVDPAARHVSDAAVDLDEYRKVADMRFTGLEDAIDNLANRVRALEEERARFPRTADGTDV